MCDFLRKLFGGDDQSAEMLALMKEQQASAKYAADVAAEEGKAARVQAQQSMLSPLDSESARRASETRMRRLLGLGGAPQPMLGAAPVSYKLLMGT
jgi:hypothetical protein